MCCWIESQILLEMLLKICSCKRFVAGGALDSHFLFCLRSETNVGAELFRLFFCSEDRNGPKSIQFWTRREKAERDRSEVRLQITAERKTDVRQPSHAGKRQQERFWRDRSKKKKKIQVSRKKKQKPLAASLPASEAGGESSRKKAEKGSMVLSDTLCYILCVSGEMHIRCCLSSLNMPLLLMRDQAG